MIVLPIVGRELRVAARRAVTYRTRLWAAIAGMALAGWKALSFGWQAAPMAVQGRSLFFTLSGLAFVYCLFIGARVTADCVSEEKREGTLGLLFLTDLRGVDVVLGKLVASSVNSVYGLLAVLPLLAMPLLLGGVTLAQFAKMVLVLTNTLFFSLSIGMWVSSMSRNERRAVMGTMLAVVTPAAAPLCILFFLLAVREAIQSPADLNALLPWLAANPVFAFVASLPQPAIPFVAIPPWTVWYSLAAVHAASWVVLLITARLVPVVWRDRVKVANPAAKPSWIERWRTWARGNFEQRRALRTRLLNRNPFLWLVSRDRLKPAYAWFFLFSMIAIWLWGYWEHREVMFDFYPLVPTIMLIHTFLKVWVISEVSHRLVEDQRNGAMELLLSTPLTMEEILDGQRMALIRQFRWPVLALGAIEVAVFQSTYSLGVLLPVVVVLVADLFTLMWVSMLLSLAARSINEVLFKSFFLVLVLPWIAYLLAWPVWTWGWRHLFWTHVMGSPWNPSFQQRVSLWFGLGLLNDFLLVLYWARPQLLNPFREGSQWPRAGGSGGRCSCKRGFPCR